MGTTGGAWSGWLPLALALAVVPSVVGVARVEAQADDARYDALLADAVAEYGAGNFAEARALFAQAHAIRPNARTLRGMGMAAFEVREYVDALRHLRAALESEERPLTSQQRAHAEGLVRRANAFVGRFTVALTPADARLSVDGMPAALEPDGTLVLNLGRHQLVADCPTCEEVSRTVVVRGGERTELDLRLEAHGPTGSSTGTPSAESEAPSPDGQGGRRHGAAWLLAGAGLAAAATVGTGLWWSNRGQEVSLCDAPNVCANRDTLARQRNAALGLTIGLGLSAAALVTVGMVRLLASRKEAGERAWACAPGPLAGACEVRF
jgi:hypothetical protein